MHEFSIVQNIVDIVLETASLHHVDQVSKVELEVGQASGVVPEAMEFAWEAATKNTLLNKAVLSIKLILLTVECRKCRRQYHPEELYDSCPVCGEIDPEIIGGKELKVIAIET